MNKHTLSEPVSFCCSRVKSEKGKSISGLAGSARDCLAFRATPTIEMLGFPPGCRKAWPIGFSWLARNSFTQASFTITAGCDDGASSDEKPRPCTMGTPIAAKYPGVIVLLSELLSRSGGSGARPTS